jgi:hypothetical protein
MAKPSFEECKARLGEINEEAILFDGYEEALVGVCEQFGRPPVACYDYDLCIKILMERDGMSHEDAVEFFDFNSLGCCADEANNPVFVTLFTDFSSPDSQSHTE